MRTQSNQRWYWINVSQKSKATSTLTHNHSLIGFNINLCRLSVLAKSPTNKLLQLVLCSLNVLLQSGLFILQPIWRDIKMTHQDWIFLQTIDIIPHSAKVDAQSSPNLNWKLLIKYVCQWYEVTLRRDTNKNKSQKLSFCSKTRIYWFRARTCFLTDKKLIIIYNYFT